MPDRSIWDGAAQLSDVKVRPQYRADDIAGSCVVALRPGLQGGAKLGFETHREDVGDRRAERRKG